MPDIEEALVRHNLIGVPGIRGPVGCMVSFYIFMIWVWSIALPGPWSALPWVGLAVAAFWVWPFKPWLEIDDGRLVGYLGRKTWQMGRLEDLASAVAVIVPAFPFSLLFSGITHQCVQLRFLSRGDKRVRVLELKLADEEAFLDALAAADPALARSPGRVVRVPASALEEADG